ncbi:MAG: radical SAM protein, partial [candidate division WOR-3 bacterium]|nr:radical SAM protein [candidate division WOR-3 bacterium]
MKKYFVPVYLNTNLKIISEQATILLSKCEICPRKCRVNRLNGELGHCKTGKYAIVSSFGPHFGEEPELVGQHGSGTIFFSYCNLNCIFCQNYDISQLGYGTPVEPDELANIMLKLQKMGCHNINLVSPTHIVPQFLQALTIAKDKGLNIPIVYNSGG